MEFQWWQEHPAGTPPTQNHFYPWLRTKWSFCIGILCLIYCHFMPFYLGCIAFFTLAGGLPMETSLLAIIGCIYIYVHCPSWSNKQIGLDQQILCFCIIQVCRSKIEISMLCVHQEVKRVCAFAFIVGGDAVLCWLSGLWKGQVKVSLLSLARWTNKQRNVLTLGISFDGQTTDNIITIVFIHLFLL